MGGAAGPALIALQYARALHNDGIYSVIKRSVYNIYNIFAKLYTIAIVTVYIVD